MATSPSLTISSITNAVITSQGESVSKGKITWSVSGQGEAAFNATKANYNTDTSGWSSRYYWSSKSGTVSFDGLSNTKTVTATVTVYTKSIVKSSSGTYVTYYNTESEAQAACDAVEGSSSYIYQYQVTSSGYAVYRYDLSIETTSNSVTLTQSVDVSGYITVDSSVVSPTYSISCSSTSATAYITNLSSGNSVVFNVLNMSGDTIGSSSGTASGTSLSLTVSGLLSNQTYGSQVLVNGTSIGYQDFTTAQGESEPAHSITAGDDYVTVRFYNYPSTYTMTVVVGEQSVSRTGNGSVTISGLSPGTSYIGFIYVNGNELEKFAFTTTGESTSNYPYIFNSGISDNTGTKAFVMVYNTKSTYSAAVTINGVNSGPYACKDDVTNFVFATEPYNIYEVKIVINGTTLTTTINTTPNTGEFQWATVIYRGAKMNSWQNPANGSTHPAPVTANEWNGLVTLVNQKCGTSIDTVSSGTRIKISSEASLRLVADALGVSIPSNNIITAQFFLDLQDAINNK